MASINRNNNVLLFAQHAIIVVVELLQDSHYNKAQIFDIKGEKLLPIICKYESLRIPWAIAW